MRIRRLLLQSLQALAIAWSIVLVLCLSIDLHHIAKKGIDYDLANIYPTTWVDDVRSAAQKNLSPIKNYRTIFMVGFPEDKARYFDDYITEIKRKWEPPEALTPIQFSGLDINEYFAFYRLISNRLMNLIDQHTVMQLSDEALLARAVESLTAVGHSTFIAKADDPLGFFAQWAQKRMPKSTLLQRGDTLKLYAEHKVWGIFLYRANDHLENLNPFELNESITRLQNLATQLDPNAEILTHGQPYESATMARIQISELVAIVCFHIFLIGFLLRLWSRSKRMAYLTILCVLASYVFSLATMVVVFQKISLWTLVAGSAVTGLNVVFVALYLFTQRLYPKESPLRILDRLLSRIAWCLGISMTLGVILYIAPMPTIKQLGVFFSASAISGAITLILFFPFLSSQPIGQTDFTKKMSTYCRYFPRFSLTHWQHKPSDYTASLTALAIFVLIGMFQLNFHQSVRDFVNIPSDVAEEHRKVESLMMLPNTTKFFLITTPSTQETLMAEEALRLVFVQRGLTDDGMTTTCVSKWFPSIERQHRIEYIRHLIFNKIRQPLSELLGTEIQEPSPPQLDVTFEDWLNSPTASPSRYLWLDVPNGSSSIIQIAGIDDESIQKLIDLSHAIAGASYVDTEADIDQLLDQYRFIFVGIFALFVVCSITVSLFHYGFRSGKVVIPPLIGISVSVAILSCFGVPFTAFSAIAINACYGFGIILALVYFAHDDDETRFSLTTFSFLAMAISFGIIGLSSTPGITQFGFTGALALITTGISLLLIRPRPKH